MKCSICGKKLKREEIYYGDVCTYYEGKPLCESCYFENEPVAIVYYGKDETPYIISEVRNETAGDFTVRWKSIDPWRGYYESKSEKYVLVNTAELLAYHQSEEILKKFDERIRELFDEYGIDYARVLTRSSNVFCQNYDLYVRENWALLGKILVEKVKTEVDYSNPKWYRNIIFDENALIKLAEFFPEKKIKTDYDAFELMKELGENVVDELKRRMKEYKRNSARR